MVEDGLPSGAADAVRRNYHPGRGKALPARLRQIADDMQLLLAQFQPQAMAVEELFFNNNITTGIGVAQAREFSCWRRSAGVPIFEYTPSQVKQAVVGYGKAEKRQVMDMTRRLLLSAVPSRTTPPTQWPSPCATPVRLPPASEPRRGPARQRAR